jgi:hypothetical protein
MIGARRTGLLALAITLTLADEIFAAEVSYGVYSRRESPSRASIGGSVQVSHHAPGRSGASAPSAPPVTPGIGTGYTPPSGQPSYPSGSRYWDVGRVPCTAPAGTVGTCYDVTAPGRRGPRAGRGAPPIDPRVLAQLAAERLALVPGSIEVSPSRQVKGLTGAPSWFWLDPAPTTESVTVAQGGESVTVTAIPSSVVWAFGDGDEVDGGPGRPYGEHADRRGAVRHTYRTRCLPGDQGRDPYVLASCTPDGYQVQASVEWTISFQAVGPIAAAGGLPLQTTSTTITYPVTEVRGFLSREGAPR